MNYIVSFFAMICFCLTSYAQNQSAQESRFLEVNINNQTSALIKEPNKDVLITGNPQFKSWILDSIKNELTSGIWESTSGKWKFQNSHWEYCRILSGVSIITENTGKQFIVKAGDSFILKPGFSGTWEVVETTRKNFVAVAHDTNKQIIVKPSIGVIKAIEYYIEGGKKGNSKITAKAFTDKATMSWSENGQLKTVPIQVLYDIVDKNGASNASYELIECNIEKDIAIAKIQSQFGSQKYIDMFTLVKEVNEWKIVSKIYIPL